MNQDNGTHSFDGAEAQSPVTIRGPSCEPIGTQPGPHDPFVEEFPQFARTRDELIDMLKRRYRNISEDDVFDIVGDSTLGMIEALRNMSRRSEIRTVKSYLYGVVARQAAKRFGANSRTVSQDLDAVPDIWTETEFERLNRRMSLDLAMQDLARDNQDILWCDAAGMTAEETRLWLLERDPPLTLSACAVRQRLVVAKRDIRAKVGAEGLEA